MSKAVRTILSIMVALVLFSTVTMAQAGGNADKNKNDSQHQSHLAKAEFWRHHKDSSKNAKQAQAFKPASGKPAQIKPVSAKASAGKSELKPQQHESASKPSSKKAPAASKAKPQDRQTASSKQ